MYKVTEYLIFCDKVFLEENRKQNSLERKREYTNIFFY